MVQERRWRLEPPAVRARILELDGVLPKVQLHALGRPSALRRRDQPRLVAEVGPGEHVPRRSAREPMFDDGSLPPCASPDTFNNLAVGV